MKILVTGGAGFIGSWVADAFLGEGHEVVIIDDMAPPVEAKTNFFTSCLKDDSIRCKVPIILISASCMGLWSGIYWFMGSGCFSWRRA